MLSVSRNLVNWYIIYGTTFNDTQGYRNWHVSSRSCEACCELLYLVTLLYFSLLNCRHFRWGHITLPIVACSNNISIYLAPFLRYHHFCSVLTACDLEKSFTFNNKSNKHIIVKMCNILPEMWVLERFQTTKVTIPLTDHHWYLFVPFDRPHMIFY